MSDPDDMETLAAVEHESWSGWAEWMMATLNKEVNEKIEDQCLMLDGDLFLSGLPCVKRWRRQVATPYADLSEKEKESDRKVVREKLPAYRPEVVSCMDICSACGGRLDVIGVSRCSDGRGGKRHTRVEDCEA